MAGSHSANERRATIARAALQLKARNGRRHAPATLPHLLILTDDAVPMDMRVLAESLPKGAGIIIRSKDPVKRAALARTAIAAAKPRGLAVLIASDWKLALELHADGCHLPETMMARARGLRRLKGALILTAAAHGPDAMRKAHSFGLDAILVSPVFPTQSHPGTSYLGVRGFSALARRTGLPAYALGGLSAHNAHMLKSTGAIGLALIRGWL